MLTFSWSSTVPVEVFRVECTELLNICLIDVIVRFGFGPFLISGPSGGRQAASTPTAPSIVDHTDGGVPEPFAFPSGPKSCVKASAMKPRRTILAAVDSVPSRKMAAIPHFSRLPICNCLMQWYGIDTTRMSPMVSVMAKERSSHV